MAANTHGAGGNAAGSKSLALAPTGEGSQRPGPALQPLGLSCSRAASAARTLGSRPPVSEAMLSPGPCRPVGGVWSSGRSNGASVWGQLCTWVPAPRRPCHCCEAGGSSTRLEATALVWEGISAGGAQGPLSMFMGSRPRLSQAQKWGGGHSEGPGVPSMKKAEPPPRVLHSFAYSGSVAISEPWQAAQHPLALELSPPLALDESSSSSAAFATVGPAAPPRSTHPC